MTPLEIALQNQEREKNRCNDTTEVNGILYCNKSGRIILPMSTKNVNGKLECDITKCRNM